jgi:hypothetical protein
MMDERRGVRVSGMWHTSLSHGPSAAQAWANCRLSMPQTWVQGGYLVHALRAERRAQKVRHRACCKDVRLLSLGVGIVKTSERR